MEDDKERNNKIMRDAYLDQVGGGIWNNFFLSDEENEEWDSIVNDYRNGEDREIHLKRVLDFKTRMDEQYSHKK